ncbi:MAG TPA: hypothetical protein PLE01_01870, partial [Syntrophothermus lipocalidus]|nr:hypothetical protein [Syntrophothermus lipocalidus]
YGYGADSGSTDRFGCRVTIVSEGIRCERSDPLSCEPFRHHWFCLAITGALVRENNQLDIRNHNVYIGIVVIVVLYSYHEE